MLRSRVLAVLLVSVMAALTPLAHATPPDAGWIAGFWDSADYDDVVLLITGSVGAVDAHPPLGPSLSHPVVDFILALDEGSVPAPTLSANRTRAPPA
jgi:hypothetical protein